MILLVWWLYEKNTFKKLYYLFNNSTCNIWISIYIVMLFNRSKEYYENNSVLADVLYEILPKNNLSVSDNLNNYLLENSNLIIYISSGKDKNIKEFENSFKSYIIGNNLKNDIIYIDSNDIKKSNFIEDLFNNYASNDVILSNKPTIKYPTLIIFKNGKIINVYNEKIPNLYSVKIFLMTNGVEIND